MMSRTVVITLFAFLATAMVCTPLSAQQYSVDFGAVQMTKSKDSTFTLTNSFPFPIAITSMTILNNPSDFSIVSGGGPVTVQPYASHTAVLRFAPTALGVRTDSLVVEGLFVGSPIYVDLIGDGTVLPVELISFSIQRTNDGVMLSWQTASESNNAGFKVQKAMSDAGARDAPSVFQTIGFVAGAGTTTIGKRYSFLDSQPAGAGRAHWYRLLQVDTDGSAHPSRPLRAENDAAPSGMELTVSPNPVADLMNVAFNLTREEQVTLEIVNIAGKTAAKLARQTLGPGSHFLSHRIGHLPAGIYALRLIAGSEMHSTTLILSR